MSKLTEAQELACNSYQIIKLDPQTWKQNNWRSNEVSCAMTSDGEEQRTRCGTKLCWGGHVVVLAGGKFITNDPESYYFDRLIAEHFDHEDFIEKQAFFDTTIRSVDVSERLQALLKVSEEALEPIVNGENNLEDIRRSIIDILGVDPETRMLTSDPAEENKCSNPLCSLCN